MRRLDGDFQGVASWKRNLREAKRNTGLGIQPRDINLCLAVGFSSTGRTMTSWIVPRSKILRA